MRKTLIRLCLLVFILVLTRSITHADPVVITSGFLSVTGFLGSPVYSFSGPGFSATALGADFGATGPANCFPCVSGNVISTSSNYVGQTLGRGTVTFNGVTFSNVFITGVLTFTGPTIVVPVTNSSVTLTAPFILSGFMGGCVETHLVCQTTVFSTQVTGGGVASIQLEAFDSQGRTLFEFRNVTYTFDSTTIPEPASILLLTSGLAALGAARVKRRARRE
jgi:hypothetical protein